NRIIWLCVKRSKLLPLGSKPDEIVLNNIRNQLLVATDFAKTRGVVELHAETIELYKRLYIDLANEKPGLIGILTARSEPIILRLALIYALLDLSEKVMPEHL